MGQHRSGRMASVSASRIGLLASFLVVDQAVLIAEHEIERFKVNRHLRKGEYCKAKMLSRHRPYCGTRTEMEWRKRHPLIPKIKNLTYQPTGPGERRLSTGLYVTGFPGGRWEKTVPVAVRSSLC